MNFNLIRPNDYSRIESLEYVELQTENEDNFGMILAYISSNKFVNGIGTGHWAVVSTNLIPENDKDNIIQVIGEKFDKLSKDYLFDKDFKCISTQYKYGNQKYIFRTKSLKDYHLLTMPKDGALTKKLGDKEQIFAEGSIGRMRLLAKILQNKSSDKSTELLPLSSSESSSSINSGLNKNL